MNNDQSRVTEIESPALMAVKDFYHAIANGNVDGVLALLHSNLEWTEAEGFPYFSGTWRTPQEVVEKLLVPLSRDWNSFAATAHDFIESGDRVVSFGVYSGISKATNKSIMASFTHVWKVKDGMLASFNMYTDTLLIARAMT